MVDFILVSGPASFVIEGGVSGIEVVKAGSDVGVKLRLSSLSSPTPTPSSDIEGGVT